MVKADRLDGKRKHARRFAMLLCFSLVILAGIKNHFQLNQTVELSGQQSSVKHVLEKQVHSEVAPKVVAKNDLLKHMQSKPLTKPMIDNRLLIDWVNSDQFSKARHYLIQVASKAVDKGDKNLLGNVLELLARVAATEGDLASTEIYLFESLDIFKQLSLPAKIADTHLLLGQMYAKRRRIAQKAGSAYGDLLMARFHLSRGENYAAKDLLDASIKSNLALGRTGAAASSYKTMARYYRSINDINGVQNALIEAGKYYAHSGQSQYALQVLDQLKQHGGSLGLLENLERQISIRLNLYESQFKMTRQARDYMRLYSLYKSKSEAGRAWKFRVKASEILSRTDKRDMYFRSPDVMAVLYDSNFNLSKAASYYQQAQDHYLSENIIDSYERTAQLQSVLN